VAFSKTSPDDLDEIRTLLAEVRRDVRELIEFLQARLEKHTT